jgi:methyltransferase FkbM-like protein
MSFAAVKQLLPNKPIRLRVLRGPFRGARVVMSPRDSLRKILGLYEHELNNWLEQALCRVSRVVDVGANDGYFTFGAAAAFRRLGKTGEVIACEPEDRHVAILRQSLASQAQTGIRFEIVHALVGRELKPGMITLDSLRPPVDDPSDKVSTLVKIDVEGAEVDVIEGGRSWLQPSNLFVIEVHQERFLNWLRELFAEQGLRLVQLDQHPLLLLGREAREEKNWWLVSELSELA